MNEHLLHRKPCHFEHLVHRKPCHMRPCQVHSVPCQDKHGREEIGHYLDLYLRIRGSRAVPTAHGVNDKVQWCPEYIIKV